MRKMSHYSIAIYNYLTIKTTQNAKTQKNHVETQEKQSILNNYKQKEPHISAALFVHFCPIVSSKQTS